MSFPAYADSKDSGISWLGEVPDHWDVVRVKHVLREMGSGGTPDTKNETFWADDGGTAWVAIGDMSNRDFIDDTEKHVSDAGLEDKRLDVWPAGTLLFSMYASLGHVAVLRREAATNQAILALLPGERIDQLFLKRWFEFIRPHLREQASSNTQDNLNSEKVRNLPAVRPPLDEQKAISSFLDVETSKIDGLVSEQRRLIELLKEKRQAVISHAVTKGLNPNAPMKPSGIQWLGDVPQHWSTTILKRLVADRRPITYGIVQPGEPDPNGRFMIRGGDYSAGWCEQDEVFRVSDAIEIPYTRSRMKSGDLIITIVGAGVGNVAVIPDWLDGANITQTSARIALTPEKANAEFVCLALQGIIGQKNLDLNVYGAAQPRLNIAHVDKYVMTVPPLDEQREIAEYINEKVDRFGTLVAEAERAIELLQERRTALISAAVTGKIDVRQFAHQETA